MISVLLLAVIAFLSWRAAPREREEDTHVHGAGQIGLLAALALFGVDYFTSYYYATGEMMSALHPYNLQHYAYIAVIVISLANLIFGALYMASLGVFNEGGGSYTASMRYLRPTLSLIVAVTLIQDYVLTIVVSALSGADQLLSVLNAYGANWIIHFLIGAVLAAVTWYLTIRGRGESSQVVFMLLGIFALLTVVLFTGLVLAARNGVTAVPTTVAPEAASLPQAMLHMLTASMKGMVALTGLEAMSNGIQFVKNEDAGIVAWGRKHLPNLNGVWNFYSGKSGIGRFVQTSFLFYGGVTTLILTIFSIHFNVFDGTLGRTLVGNLAAIAFDQIPGGTILFWAYQILAVALLAAASMTAFQDTQATAWRDVPVMGLPEPLAEKNAGGTFTKAVHITFALAVIIMLLVRGNTSAAVPFYGVGVFMPIMVMGLAMRQHVLQHFQGQARQWGATGATVAAVIAGIVFIGQIAGKWSEGGWIVLISFTVLALLAHTMLLSPMGVRNPQQIKHIVRDKARVQGSMASIVEWQSLKMQEYRYGLLTGFSKVLALFGVHEQVIYKEPIAAGEYDSALHVDHPDAPSIIDQYLDKLSHETPATKPGASGNAPAVTVAKS